MKLIVFWDTAPYSLVEVDVSELTASNLQGDDGDSTHLRNVPQLLRDYTAQYSRRLSALLIVFGSGLVPEVGFRWLTV
jgi:hypothetical protein